MTITTHRETPCWQIVRADSGQPPETDSGDGWPHYATEAEAKTALRERCDGEDLGSNSADYRVVESFPAPCARVVCDECGDELDGSGEGWTHFDPDQHPPVEVAWVDIDWVERDGKHYHADCAPPYCEDCETEGHDVDDCEVHLVTRRAHPWRLLTVVLLLTLAGCVAVGTLWVGGAR